MIDARNYQVTENLRNGLEACIRASRPDDTDRIVEAFHKLEPESVYFRFFGSKKELSEADLQRLRDTDFTTRVVLLCTVPSDGRETVIGLANYALTSAAAAEISFIVEEDYHGQGIAGRLLEHLGRIAKDAGIRTFTAEMLPQNHSMRRVFERSGWPMTIRTSDGVAIVTFDLGASTTD